MDAEHLSGPASEQRAESVSVETLAGKSQDGDRHGHSRFNLSPFGKLGIWATLYIAVGTAFSLAAFGVLAFLWFGDPSNALWNDIMVRGWLLRAVAICADVIKAVVGLQVGAAAAMMAAIALESFDVLLLHAASLSVMRAAAGSGAVYTLLWHLFKALSSGGLKRSAGLFILVEFVTAILLFSNAFSVLLLSDIDSGILRGTPQRKDTAFGFNNTYYKEAPNTAWLRFFAVGWNRAPSAYPAFAEYHEPPEDISGVRDTGKTLRAFLPFVARQDRETVGEYTGRSTVIDTRVSCQVPHFDQGIMVSRSETGSRPSTLLAVQGGVAPSKMTPMMGIPDPQSYSARFVPFTCAAPTETLGILATNPWRLSICQLYDTPPRDLNIPHMSSGGLLSEFFNGTRLEDIFGDSYEWYDDSRYYNEIINVYGYTYLVLNVTSGNTNDWQTTSQDSGSWISPLSNATQGEWLDLSFTGASRSPPPVLSITLCYSAFSQADIPIHVTSSSNRTESSPVVRDPVFGSSFESLREQYGQNPDKSPDERGILQMHNQSWLVTDFDDVDEVPGLIDGIGRMAYPKPYLRTAVEIPTAVTTSPLTVHDGSVSAIMCDLGPYDNNTSIAQTLLPNVAYIRLVQEILQTNGSVAFALQSLTTLLSSMTYYDNVEHFDRSEGVQQVFLVSVNVPASHRGFVAVAIALVAHCVLMAGILAWFLCGTRFSRLGATWAAIAQVLNDDSLRYLHTDAVMKDGDVEKQMGKNGVSSVRVGIEMVGGGIGLSRRKKNQ